MTQPTPTAAPPALLNITLGVMLALMLGWFFHIASGVLVPLVLGLMISYVVIAAVIFSPEFHWDARRALAKLDGKDAVPPKSEELSFKAAARRVRNVAIGFSAILVGVSSVSYAISLTIKATATG